MRTFFLLILTLNIYNICISQNSDSLFDKGYRSYEKGEFEEAIKYYHLAIDIDNNNGTKDWVHYYNIGLAYQKIDSLQVSNIYLDTCLMLNPNLDAAYLTAGNNFLLLGKTKEAIHIFNRGIEINSESDCFHNRGYAYFIMENYSMALDDFETSMKTDSSSILSIAFAIRSAAMIQQISLAKKYFDKLKKRLSNDSILLLELKIWIEANKKPLNEDKLFELISTLKKQDKDNDFDSTVKKFQDKSRDKSE